MEEFCKGLFRGIRQGIGGGIGGDSCGIVGWCGVCLS